METKKYYVNAEVSAEVHAWLKAKADAELRSMSQQLVWELEKSRKETEGEK